MVLLISLKDDDKRKYHSYKGQVGKVADNIIDRDCSTIVLF